MTTLPKPSPLTVKRALLAALALAIAGALAYALSPRRVPVDTEVLAKGSLRVTTDEEGKTRIKDVYTVSAPIAGKVLRSMLEPGDEVIRDKTLVASILPASPPFLDFRSQQEAAAHVQAAEAAVALAEAELRQSRSELGFAERDLTRAEALAKRDTIAERTLEQARLAVDTGRAAVLKSEASREVRLRELASARARLIEPTDPGVAQGDLACCLEVRSPVSGRVLRVIQKSEQMVASGAPLVEIGDPRAIEIVVELLSTEAVKVREGATATIEAWGGEALPAKVTRIEPAGFTKVSALGIEEQRVRVLLEIDGAPAVAARLGHEFRVFVRIVVAEADGVLKVPLGALYRSAGSWAVFVVEDGRAVPRRITLGARNATHAEVTDGLAAGARIILHPSDRIAAGVKVSERSSAAVQ